jgi:hypothetical protein
MARYSHLPLYKSVYVLTREVFRLQQKMPKTIKFSLGQMMFESSLRCTKGIIVANGSKNKLKPLQEISLEVEVIWTYLRLLYDLKGISIGEFQHLSERLAEVSPQLQAWLKWEKERIKQEGLVST